MAANALSEYLEDKVFSADRVELVQILCQAAAESVEKARRHLKQRDILARSKEINKAHAILGQLIGSLNHSVDSDFSRTSHALYDYMQRRLLEANFQQSDPPLAEVSKLLATLLEGWMHCQVPATAPQAAPADPAPEVQPTAESAGYSAYMPSAPAPAAYAPPVQRPAYAPYTLPYAPPAYASTDYDSLAEEGETSDQPRFACSY